MKKLLILFVLIIMVGEVFPQPIVNRASSNNTVQDGRGMWQYNMFAPRYVDTTTANTLKGVDSCGAVIFTYDVMSLWTRACSPKRWVRVGEVLKFGVAGEDDNGGGVSRSFDAGGSSTFTIVNSESFQFITNIVSSKQGYLTVGIDGIDAYYLGTSHFSTLTVGNTSGFQLNSRFTGGLPQNSSEIAIIPDSIRIQPFQGKLNIDSLRSATDSTANKPMSYNAATGEWKYLTYWPGGGGAATDVEALITDTYPEGGRFNGAILELNRTKWTNPGLQDPRDKRLFDNGNIPEAIPFSSVDNTNTRYVGFPSATSCRQTMWATYKGAVTHVTPGSLPVMMSQDGGKNWDSINVLHPYGNDPYITNIEDTIWYCHTSGYSSKILIGYSTDGFKTKVLADSVSMPGEASYPFDKMLKFPSGKICFLTYGLDATHCFIRIVQSNGDRTDWNFTTLVTTQLMSNSFLTECSWDIVNEPTVDADADVLMVIRDEVLANGHLQMTSDDGALTWDSVGRITQLKSVEDVYPFPAYVKKYGKDVFITAAPRTNVPGVSTAPDYYITSLRGIVDSVFTDPTKWPLPNVLYKSQDSYRGVGDAFDFGYSFPFIYNNTLLVIFYDVSPLRDPPAIWTRIAVMPVVGLNGLELFTTTNQSIPNATKTLVTLSRIRVDTELAFSTSLGMVVIPRDGVYTFDFVGSYVASTDGTYKQFQVEIIDPGETTANRIWAEETKLPTNNQAFMRFELSGEALFLKAGERVAVYTMHDGGSEELFNQGDAKYRVDFKLKKFDK